MKILEELSFLRKHPLLQTLEVDGLHPGDLGWIEAVMDDHKKRLPSEASMAASILGSIKTEKKAASSRENGKKGGRPVGRISGEKAHILDCGAWSSPKGWFIRDRFIGRTIKEAFETLMADFYAANKR